MNYKNGEGFACDRVIRFGGDTAVKEKLRGISFSCGSNWQWGRFSNDFVAEHKLVLWEWEPGPGRTKPPLSHPEFVANMRASVDNGALLPE
jgi:hypothetical protein